MTYICLYVQIIHNTNSHIPISHILVPIVILGGAPARHRRVRLRVPDRPLC